MTQEDFCSYEVSKLLKEKGFDESTMFVWYQHLPISLDCRNLANKKARDYFYYNETTKHNSSYRNSSDKPEYIHGDIFSCPTHQMAMKWLRKKGIDIIIMPVGANEYNEKKYYVWQAVGTRDKADTFEEAVEAALKYCLTELI